MIRIRLAKRSMTIGRRAKRRALQGFILVIEELNVCRNMLRVCRVFHGRRYCRIPKRSWTVCSISTRTTSLTEWFRHITVPWLGTSHCNRLVEFRSHRPSHPTWKGKTLTQLRSRRHKLEVYVRYFIVRTLLHFLAGRGFHRMWSFVLVGWCDVQVPLCRKGVLKSSVMHEYVYLWRESTLHVVFRAHEMQFTNPSMLVTGTPCSRAMRIWGGGAQAAASPWGRRLQFERARGNRFGRIQTSTDEVSMRCVQTFVNPTNKLGILGPWGFTTQGPQNQNWDHYLGVLGHAAFCRVSALQESIEAEADLAECMGKLEAWDSEIDKQTWTDKTNNH